MLCKPFQPHPSLHDRQYDHKFTAREIVTGINVVDGCADLMGIPR